MSLPGIIIMHGKNFAIECKSPMNNEPKMVRHVWEIANQRVTGMTWQAAEDAIGRPATIRDGRVSCYLGQGNYLHGELAQGGATPAVIVEMVDISPPRVRAPTETRWHSGRWEKYSKRHGWVVA